MKKSVYYFIILALVSCVSKVNDNREAVVAPVTPEDPRIQERVLLLDASGANTRMIIPIAKDKVTSFTAILNKKVDFPQNSYKLEFVSHNPSIFTVSPENCLISKETSCVVALSANSDLAAANLSITINDSTTPNKTVTKQIRVS